MAATRRLSDLVSATLSKLELPAGPVVVALSGGADSAALAFLTVESGVETRGIHIDHRLAASPMMAAAAEEIAARVGIELEMREVTVGDGPSPEDQARQARYQVLEEAGRTVLTAHTRDDSIETMLINLIRGTGPTGLTGIPRFRPPAIHRPMLEVTRSDTREIASLAGLPFRDDPMNEDLSITRNRVRLEILPLMRELNPGVDASLARAAAALRRDSEYLDDLAGDLYRGALPVSVLNTVPRVLADRMLHRALEESGVGATADRIERMWSVAAGRSDRQDLADGRRVVRRGALLSIE